METLWTVLEGTEHGPVIRLAYRHSTLLEPSEGEEIEIERTKFRVLSHALDDPRQEAPHGRLVVERVAA